MVGEKIFVLASADHVPTRASIKVDPEIFEDLVAGSNCIQAPYMAKGQWVQFDDIELEQETQLKALIQKSYWLVAGKLTKKVRLELGIEMP